MNFTTYAIRLAGFVTNKPDMVDYSIMLPATIDAAEQRIYRELDLLTTVTRNSSKSLAVGSRDFALPTNAGTFIIVQGINVITPYPQPPSGGTRVQLAPVSRDYLDAVWGNSAANLHAIPREFAMIDNANIIVGPWPDQPYTVEVIGTMRPAALSPSNPNTFLTTNLPDLFFAASMVFFSRMVADLGTQVQNGPDWWENQFQLLKQSAMGEEMRRKFASGDWNSMSTPNP